MKKTILNSAIVTAFITFTLTVINIDFKDYTEFLFIWLRSWSIAFSIAYLFNKYILPHFNSLKN